MKNYFMRNPLLMLAAALLTIPLWAGIRETGTTPAKTFTGKVTDSICAQNGSHAPVIAKTPTMGRDSATCTKRCAERGAKYVLVDDSTKAVYMLDTSPQVEALAGRRVRVTGTVEGNKITVTNLNALG